MLKILVLFCFVLLVNTRVFAGDDSLYVEINKDTLIVYNVNVWGNCAFSPLFQIDFIGSLIKITEIDTSTDEQQTTCSMYKDFMIPVVGLNEGNYKVEIWRDYTTSYHSDTAIFISSIDIEFVITNINNDIDFLAEYKIYNAYPNPFNPETIISYFIPKEDFVKIIVYDNLGREMEVLFSGVKVKGKHELLFRAMDYSSGIYFIKVVSQNKSMTQRIVLLK